ncbi:glycosyltransferase family 4 protein [Marinobacter psychrophilus]|uniref:glycosyltransferase family 4 protein n=1 Tax=Marinobacter psychrophilus TaxID=330734 RepID=UPI001B56B4F0|nr:glycosyltransferase family 4 protein [Marinobacter psychrophilus]MBQ0761677.1 glycosyltransferase family 4 protein [Marinobacter psychrophilus]MBQ0844211.1 glycosyltransferase family 4 protein [Marinobacter psychrophilus]
MKLLVISSYVDTLNAVRPEAEMLIELSKLGVTVELMTQPDAEYRSRFESEGIKVHGYHPRKKFEREAIARIRNVLKDGHFDAVYSFNNKAIANVNLAALGLPVKVLTYRGQTGNISRWDPSCYLTHLSPRVDRILCVSKATRDDLQKHVWGNRNKVCAVYKGHDLEWYRDTPVDLASLGIPAGAFVVGSVANLRPRKGLPVLLEAARDLPADSNIHVLLVGGGLDTPEVDTLIAACPMAEHIHRVGFRRDAPALIAACDVSVLASTKREGLPKTVIEAMAYGVAPIVSDTGGSVELIEDGISGIRVTPGSAQEISAAIKRLYSDPVACNAMGEKARLRIASHFHVKQSAQALLQVLTETVNGEF